MDHLIHSLRASVFPFVDRKRVGIFVAKLVLEPSNNRFSYRAGVGFPEQLPVRASPPSVQYFFWSDGQTGKGAVQPPGAQKVEKLDLIFGLVLCELNDSCPIALEGSLIDETERGLFGIDDPACKNFIDLDIKVAGQNAYKALRAACDCGLALLQFS
jgi:hypothetical protein